MRWARSGEKERRAIDALLLVEDNARLSEFLREGLAQAGFEFDQAFTAADALSSLGVQDYDLAVLDLGLPDRDGFSVLRDIRAKNKDIPILILTARDSLDDRIKGLNGGADDYVLKPFAIEELIARVRALLRRPGQSLGAVIEYGNLSYNPEKREAAVGGKAVHLTRRELDLLEQLIRSAEQVVGKDRIESRLYSYGEEGSSNSVEVLMHRLRKKLEDGGASVQIHTLRGIGYMMAVAEGDSPHDSGS